MHPKTQNAGKASIRLGVTHRRVNGAAPVSGSLEVAAMSLQGYRSASSAVAGTAKTGEGEI